MQEEGKTMQIVKTKTEGLMICFEMNEIPIALEVLEYMAIKSKCSQQLREIINDLEDELFPPVPFLS